MSKSGSASHAATSSDINKNVLRLGIPVFMAPVGLKKMVSFGSNKMVSSVSLGHAATNPESEVISQSLSLHDTVES